MGICYWCSVVTIVAWRRELAMEPTCAACAMEPTCAACAMEWSIQLEMGLRSAKPGYLILFFHPFFFHHYVPFIPLTVGLSKQWCLFK